MLKANLLWSSVLLTIVCSALPTFAVKNRQREFREPCDAVWTAAVAVAKSQNYRIVSISKEEQIVSLIAGGAWSGERILTLNLAPGVERGCIATVQSRFSGLVHSDGPDLLARIGVELIAQTTDRNSKPFQRYKRCVDGYNSSIPKCEERLRKEMLASSEDHKLQDPSKDWWRPTDPTPR